MSRLLDIAMTSLLTLAALVVLVLAGQGAFRSATTFPLIFAGVVVLMGLLSLLSRRRRTWRFRSVLVGLAMALSIGAVAVHYGHLSRARRAAEIAGMKVLSTGAAPPIPYSHAVNRDAEASNPIAFDGALTLVNFWATWCDPCRKEMPTLERFWQAHRGEGLEVVGVTRLWGGKDEASMRQERLEIERFLVAAGVTYPVVVSDAPTIDAYRVRSWPTSVLVGPDSRVLSYGVGIDGAEELLALATELLKEG